MQVWAVVCGTDYNVNIPFLGTKRNHEILVAAEKNLLDAGKTVTNDLLMEFYFDSPKVKSALDNDENSAEDWNQEF